MSDTIDLNQKDFKIYKCPKHIDNKVLGTINQKKTLLRMRYILIPSFVMIGIFIGLWSFLPYFNIDTKLTTQDKKQVDMVLNLFEESILEVQNNMS